MRTIGSTDTDIDTRRDAIVKIKKDLESKHIPVNRDIVLEQLLKQNFKVTAGTVYRDLVHLSRQNTWVRDLGESTYSERQETIDKELDSVLKEAWEIYHKKWTRDTTTKKMGSNSKGEFETTEETTTQEMSGPKIESLRLILEVQKLKMAHTNKDNIHIAAAILGEDVRKLKAKYADLESIEVNVLDLAKKA